MSLNQHGAQKIAAIKSIPARTLSTPKKRGRPARSASPNLFSASRNSVCDPSTPKKSKETSLSTNDNNDSELIEMAPIATKPNRKIAFKLKTTSKKNTFKNNSRLAKVNPKKQKCMEVATDSSSNDSMSNEFDSQDSDMSIFSSDISEPIRTSRDSKVKNLLDFKPDGEHVIPNYDKITKNIPKFRGTPDDHFEAWMTNVGLYLRNQCSALTEKQKLTAVLLKVEGYPRLILKGIRKNLKTVKDIFKALKQTYGQDELTMLTNIRQLPEEAVRVYYSRLKTNLGLLGHVDTTKGQRIYLNYFLSGLLPKLRSQVGNLMPQRLEDALALANSFESKNISIEAKRSKKVTDETSDKLNVLSDGNSLDSLKASIQTFNSNLEKKMIDKFNSLSGKMGRLIQHNPFQNELNNYNYPMSSRQSEWNNEMNNKNYIEYRNDRMGHGRNEINSYRGRDQTQYGNRNSYHNNYSINRNSQHVSNSNSRSFNNDSRFKCYGCGEWGHRYRYCPNLSQDRKNQIADELRERRVHSEAEHKTNELPLNSSRMTVNPPQSRRQ